jgi:LysM repeat protein
MSMSPNPFQLPSCIQRADIQQRRRERFRRIVVAMVAALAVLLVVLLIQGCMNEHAKSAAAPTVTRAGPDVAPSAKRVDVGPKPVPTTATNPVAPPAALQPAVQKSPSKAAVSSESVYVVKPGDTLNRIARIHKTTVKALKTANDLDGDMIAVGAKLKLPPA